MMIGDRIKLARARKGYSLERLAHEIGVTKQGISKYELARSMPSSGVLVRLAHALGVKPEFFLRPDSVAINKVEFRKRSALKAKEKKALEAQLKEWIERYLEVERLLGLEQSARFKLPPQQKRRVSEPMDVEQAAVEMRRFWKLGLDPIESMTALLDEKGVKILSVEGYKAFDALTLYADSNPVVAVKKDIPGDRQRFSLAHELGHLALAVSPDVDEEKAAHRFAAAFLVPEEVARRELGRSRRSRLDLAELHVLKHKYGLSMQAWVCRARDLGIITKAQAGRMFRVFRARAWHLCEPGSEVAAEEPSKRMELLVMRALAEDLITQSRAAELLGESVNDIRRKSGLAA